MESSSPPPIIIGMIGGQRSNNTTPHHHYYSTPCSTDQQQPSSYNSYITSGGAAAGSRQATNNPGNGTRRSSASALLPSSSSHHGGGGSCFPPGSIIPSPLHHQQPPSSRETPRSRGQSPSINSLGGETNVFMGTMGPSHLHPQHHLPSHSLHTPPRSHHQHQHHQLNSHGELNDVIGHGHNHLHDDRDDDSHININSDNNSHSISPPNSNSNTTISCGSGNSTSANIGVPTSRDQHRRSRGVGGMNNKCNNLNNNNNSSEAYENYRNRSGSGKTNNKNSSIKNRSGSRKKSILEDSNELAGKSGLSDTNTNYKEGASKFNKEKQPFINPNQEFLPICDALFNMISLAAYFCDVVFDVLTVYSWYKISVESEEERYELSPSQRSRIILSGGSSLSSSEFLDSERGSLMPRELMWQWSLLGLVFIALSCTISQCLSFKWYKESERRGQKSPDGLDLEGPPPPCSSGTLIIMHMSLLGVLWRYFKLFIPVDLRFVKNEVRDLCLLRLIHAFCQAAPMLLLQLYLIWHEPGIEYISDLTKVSTALSLFSVCWALASFSKHIRRQNVHKLVLTWLGVIFQFFWRLGTVTSRFLALSLYAIAYQYWVFLVLFLHWFCMLLWLISPKNIFHGEKMSPLRKVSYSAIVAVVYTICYINVQETNSRTKVIIYYVTMFLENSLLFGVWLIAVRYEDEIWFRSTATWAVFLCFGGGLAFMALYYQYFHVKKLSYVYDAESSIYRNSSSIGGCSLINDNGSGIPTICGSPGDYDIPMAARGKTNGVIMGNSGSLLGRSNKKKTSASIIMQQQNHQSNQNFSNNGEGKGNNNRNWRKKSDNNNEGKAVGASGLLLNNNGKMNGLHLHHPNVVPGVFNCRFHPAMKRKKKKPTTFVPPPAVGSNANNSSRTTNNTVAASSQQQTPKVTTNNSAAAGDRPLNNEISLSLSSSSQLQSAAIEATIRHHENLLRATPPQHQQQLSASSHYQEPLPSNKSHPLHHHSHSHHPSHHSHLGYDNTVHYDLPEYNDDHSHSGLVVGESVSNNGSNASSSAYGPIMMTGYPGGMMIMNNTKGSSPLNTTGTSAGRMPMMVPFWRRPLSLTMGSENEGSVSSRIDIQQKLQEKKQQQLAELREIEEEIKQGKLKRPDEIHEMMISSTSHQTGNPVVVRQPIPVEKKQPWFGGDDFDMTHQTSSSMLIHPNGDHHRHHHHQEILLDPHQYLMGPTSDGGAAASTAAVPMIPQFVDSASGYYYNPDWPISPSMPNYYEPLYQNGGDGESVCDEEIDNDCVDDDGVILGESGISPSGVNSVGDRKNSRFCDRRRRINKGGHLEPNSRESIYKSYRIPSDIDSQMSLPRSYTLPREFKYKRKFRKPVKTENFLPSTNSSDGDVDSGEDPDLYSEVHPYPVPIPSMHPILHNSNSTPANTSVEVVPPTPIASSTPTNTTPSGSSLQQQQQRQSRKVPNGRPRHKLHETKL